MPVRYNLLAGGEAGRIAAVSDGIFAFAATVLVLDFHTPEVADVHTEAELAGALIASAPRLLPWLLSLMTLGIFWLGQQTQLSQLDRSNRGPDLAALPVSRLCDAPAVLDPAARRFPDLPDGVPRSTG